MGTMTRATPSMMVRVSSLEEELNAVRVAARSMEEMSILGNMPMTPKKVTPMMNRQLLAQAKGRALAERPVLLEKNAWLETATEASAEEPTPVANLLDLDEREQQVVAFLKEHREATEMDLRSVLNTRRVTGIVNGILTKAAEKGVKIIEKRGVGNRGEIYGYTGE